MNVFNSLNHILKNPTEQNIYNLFDINGFLRFNMLYISPIALKHFKAKLLEYGLKEWMFKENELIFHLSDITISFRGTIEFTFTENNLFCLEIDFDPVVPDDCGIEFLRDIETFLKKCDSCFFMTYFICIDDEILQNPLSQSIEYLATRK